MACSHEPGTVNYPGVMVAPAGASVTSRAHDDLLSRGNVAVDFIAPGQAVNVI